MTTALRNISKVDQQIETPSSNLLIGPQITTKIATKYGTRSYTTKLNLNTLREKLKQQDPQLTDYLTE
jgi:hypothetical protein